MPCHEPLFNGQTLFDRIARAVCRAGVLPRKELYEAWETARRVRRVFRGGRVVDLACGHGLLAHIMLILDDASQGALAVDLKLPKSAEVLSQSLASTWPRLARQIEWIEAPIETIAITPDDLVVSAHACGRLSDTIIEQAVSANARLGLLPCCHDKTECRTAGLESWMDVSLAIDTERVFRLKSMGYHVMARHIPPDITPKNRLILARPANNDRQDLPE